MKKSIFIMMALSLLVLCACGAQKQSDASMEENTENYTVISTPFADLRVAQDFDENVAHEVTEKTPYTIVFKTKADNVELFSIVFNGAGETVAGTLIGEEANTVVYMNVPELDKDSKNFEECCRYQEEINDIMSHLAEDYQFSINKVVDEGDPATFTTETAIGALHYPSKWQDRVTIEASKEKVCFTDGDTPLFDLVFSSCDGYLSGTYKDIPVYIVDYPVETDEQRAMQEDVNVILQHLMENPDFIINR